MVRAELDGTMRGSPSSTDHKPTRQLPRPTPYRATSGRASSSRATSAIAWCRFVVVVRPETLTVMRAKPVSTAPLKIR